MNYSVPEFFGRVRYAYFCRTFIKKLFTLFLRFSRAAENVLYNSYIILRILNRETFFFFVRRNNRNV